MARKILIATHGYLADGFKSAIGILMGTTNQIVAIDAYTEGEGGDYTNKIAAFVEGVDVNDDGVIFTDIIGGSVNQKVLQTYTKPKPNLFVVTGVNLMAILAVLLDDRAISREMLLDITTNAKVQLIDFSNGLAAVKDDENDFLSEGVSSD